MPPAGDKYSPDPKMKFTFGLWTVGNPGRDPFGLPTREQLNVTQICDMLGDVGAYGVNFHDNDLIPIDATPTEDARIRKDRLREEIRLLEERIAWAQEGLREVTLRLFPGDAGPEEDTEPEDADR